MNKTIFSLALCAASMVSASPGDLEIRKKKAMKDFKPFMMAIFNNPAIDAEVREKRPNISHIDDYIWEEKELRIKKAAMPFFASRLPGCSNKELNKMTGQIISDLYIKKYDSCVLQ